MHFPTTSSLLFLATSFSLSLASPIAPRQSPNWTVRSMLRTCDDADTSCNYSFGIDTDDGQPVTSCAYTVNGTPASKTNYNQVACGAFFIGSGYDQSGFQVLSVVRDQSIIYAGYSDAELQNGVVVSPDKSFAVQATG